VVRTGGGGWHAWYRVPRGTVVRGGNHKLGQGVDLKAEGHFVLAPGSLHVSGERYTWASIGDRFDFPLDVLGAQASEGGAAPLLPERIPEGERNGTLTSLAVTMRRRGSSEPAILAALIAENRIRCDPPLAQAEVEKIAHSVARYAPGIGIANRGVAIPHMATLSAVREAEQEPFALPLEEFVARPGTAPPVLVGSDEDILVPAGGLVILGGKGGKGKTTLTVDATFHFASGVPWLGFEVARPVRVLVIENEGPRELFRRKIEQKARTWPHEITGTVDVFTADWGAYDLRVEDLRKRLRDYVQEHDIDLVVGDPLDSLGMDGVGSPEETRAFVALANQAGLGRNVAFWLPHHLRKEKAEDELDELSGAWGGRPDTVLTLSLLAGDRARLAVPKMRWGNRGRRPTLILSFDPETEGFAIVAKEGDERDLEQEITELLADGRRRTVTEIRKPKDEGGIGASEAAVKKALKASAGFVSRSGSEVGRSAQAVVWGLAGAEPTLMEDR
jgi:AAA domain/Primase C terminal 1 (PriCT-1)/Bifunctional DNA primase/polymerase, N-terminal